jgi:response regulator RpfG family c-di-GMP phosphodiesterase
VRTFRPEVPPELDALVSRMLALKPDDRYPSPQAVIRALQLFVQPEARSAEVMAPGRTIAEKGTSEPDASRAARVYRMLVVDDDPVSRTLCRRTLQREGYQCDEAAHGMPALEAVQEQPYDLVVLDMQLPEMSGPEVLRLLRENPPCTHFKILIHSGHASPDEMAQMLAAGADDYLSKPFSPVQFLARIQAALRLKEAQDRTDLLNRHLLALNAELERNLTTRDSDLVHARNALVLALARLVEHGTGEKGSHLVRMQRFGRILAEAAAGSSNLANQIDPNFIQMLECCTPLHDIGKVGLPDHILLKAGQLEPEERIIMQSHTLIGAATLQEVAQQHSFAQAFLRMAIDITRHHHERYDGTGYPDRLAGDAIPLAARIVAIGDTYDALRCQRSYRPALPHGAAVQVMTEITGSQFDPCLRQLFQRTAPDFERIFRELPD